MHARYGGAPWACDHVFECTWVPAAAAVAAEVKSFSTILQQRCLLGWLPFSAPGCLQQQRHRQQLLLFHKFTSTFISFAAQLLAPPAAKRCKGK
jgi:hypothetical protein